MSRLVAILFFAAAPVLSAQTVVAYWEALHYTLKLEWVSSRGDTLTKASLERSELFVVTKGKNGTQRTLVATERGFAAHGPSLPGEIDTLAGTAGERYRVKVEKNALVVTRQAIEWRENVAGNIAVIGAPEKVVTIPLVTTVPSLTANVIVEARELFSRNLSLQPQRLNGQDVWVLQRCLLDEDYTEVGEVDGWFGPATRKAVTQFQQNVGLPVTGIVDAGTWKALVGPDDDETIYSGD